MVLQSTLIMGVIVLQCLGLWKVLVWVVMSQCNKFHATQYQGWPVVVPIFSGGCVFQVACPGAFQEAGPGSFSKGAGPGGFSRRLVQAVSPKGLVQVASPGGWLRWSSPGFSSSFLEG
jgi:hypothetical protein